MNKFDIFADSGNNIPDELVEKYELGVIPYLCTVNGEERACYEKGTPFAELAQKFYGDIRTGAEVKTSLIGEARFEEYLTPSLQAGKDVILFTITQTLSGTYAQAVAAKEELEKKFPKNKVYVIDTANASMGSCLLVLKVAEMRALGAGAEECASWAEENKYKVQSYVTVDDLKYLRKGGRVSAVAAIAGTLLNIKPVLWANDTTPAKLEVFCKERGKKKALMTILKAFDETQENADTQTVAIAHADCIEDANYLKEALESRGVKNIITEYYDLCTGGHVGPGTIALFFFGKDRRGEVKETQKKGLFKSRKTEGAN
ncbi:MAG: DegV family protein [Clostridia bacterium]|nr:DegV family protein [Clostridia bacterium]